MKWSWRVGTIAGIGIHIHATFTLLIAWVLFAHLFGGDTLAGAASGLAFVMAIFGCVLLHELGHALAARRYGIGTRDITLLPIGGVARLERMPDKPRQELWVALAGPAVNVVIAAGLLVWLYATRQLVPLSQLGVVTGPFAERLMAVNLLLVIFNMLPAFPMDGGRVLRALLAMRLPYARATRIAATVGQALAVGFVVLGLFANPFLMLIGVFVWLGAAQEARYAAIKAALRGVPLHAAWTRDIPLLAPADALAGAARAIGTSPVQSGLVVREGQVVGTLGIGELLEHLRLRGPATPVSEVMQPAPRALELPTTLDVALTRLQEAGVPLVPVLSEGRLVGVVTLELLEQFVAIQSAMQQYGSREAAGAARSLAVARPIRSA